jgi:hypothetical protein
MKTNCRTLGQIASLAEAGLFLEVLAGSPNPEFTFQVFDDKGKRHNLAAWKHGTLEQVAPWLTARASAGCGIFATINETDGHGRRRKNVTAARACFVDLDGAARPTKYPIKPHMIVETSPGRYHLYWLLEPTTDLVTWSDCQARLAAFYGGDPKVIDPPRVMRLPGFAHRKGQPFDVKVLEAPAPEDVRLDNSFARCSLAEIAEAHPAEYTATGPDDGARGDALKEPPGGWDRPVNVERARAYLKDAPASVEGEHGDDNAYRVACELNDLGISPEHSLDLMMEDDGWNDRCDPPWSEPELKKKIKNALAYKHTDAGSKPPICDEFEFEGPADVFTPGRLEHVERETMNDYFAFLNLGGKPAIAYWAPSPIDTKTRVIQFWSVQSFRQMLCNKVHSYTIEITDTKGDSQKKRMRTPLADSWLNDPRRRTYDGVVLAREVHSDHPQSLNIWRGYGFQPRPGDWSLMRAHIRDVIASGKRERFEYILNWISWGLQNPESPAEVALILKSTKHGTGKGLLLRTIRKLYGSHGFMIAKNDLLTGRFNAHLATTTFLFVDEVSLADPKEALKLNSMLTEDVVAIEPKGVNAFMMPNHLKLAAASNQEHVVIAADSDRRFQVFEVSPGRAQDVAYFKAIATQLDAGGYEAMLHDLLERELGDWHPREMVPDDKTAEQVASAKPELQWLAGYLDSGVLDCQPTFGTGDTVVASKFYENARKSVRQLAGWSDYRFAKFLETWDVQRDRHRSGSRWVFPLLSEMRAAWSAKYPWWPQFNSTHDEWQAASGVQSVVEEDTADI